MTGEIVDGPWSGPPVVQDPPRLTPDRWWERLDNGSLLVLCRGARHRGERYQIAPVAEWHPLEGEGTVANVVPDRTPNRDRISIALDRRGLYGPEVDEALGVADALDTVVDAWESGHLAPTESEIKRLSMLTGMLPAWFYRGTPPLIDRVFLCPR